LLELLPIANQPVSLPPDVVVSVDELLQLGAGEILQPPGDLEVRFHLVG
jgi:hypothetical protein